MKQEKLIIRFIICLVSGIIFLFAVEHVYSNPALSDFPVLPPGAEILATSPPVPVGSGARARGMGSAFIAVADDATAASWNPGGLGQLQKPEISVVGSYFSRSETYSGDHVVSQGSRENFFLDLNYLSAAYAKNIWRRNIFFSLNYQKLFDFGRKLEDFDFLAFYDKGYEVEARWQIERVNFQQEGSLYTFSPAMAIEFKPGLYIGFTYNIWSDHVTGKSQWTGKVKLTNMENGSYTKINYKYKNFRGDNYTLGFLWRVTPCIQLGGVYKKSFRANVTQEWYARSGEKKEWGWAEYPAGEHEEAYTIDFPTAYGVGLSFRIGDSWTVAGDITRTEWQDYSIIDSNGLRVGPFAQVISYPDGTFYDLDVPKDENIKANLKALQNNQRMRMRAYKDIWPAFMLEKNIIRQQPPRFARGGGRRSYRR